MKALDIHQNSFIYFTRLGMFAAACSVDKIMRMKMNLVELSLWDVILYYNMLMNLVWYIYVIHKKS